jgi:23S rRNA pseudouridine2605 synthase
VAELCTLVLDKPKGFLIARDVGGGRGPRGKRTIYELLVGAPGWVEPVGPMDRDTSGLLLLSNDRELAERVRDPAFGLDKRYRATTRARVDEGVLAALRDGLELDDGPTLPARAELIEHSGATSVVELEILEDRNHQVRRMFLAAGRPLKELRRVAIGPLAVDSVESGRWRALGADETRALREALGLGPRPSG